MGKIAIGGLFLGMIASGAEVIDAAYIIRLKNGNEYITARYWQEGSQVLFDADGGIFGVEKAFVAKIEKSSKTARLATVKDHDPAAAGQVNAETQDKDSAGTNPGVETKLEKTRDINDPVLAEYSRLKERAKAVDSLLTSEIRDLLREITAFKNKLAKDSKLFIEYGREFNEAHEVGDAVESALRSRTQ